ncbi:MAG: long-chain-fatty-acid--CoA ligase [Candidatus Goldbacteria bacterium]|nr:long-chain-fatty-acid--CoA ligase [Candidatus Goldiibacteriota bacterium]
MNLIEVMIRSKEQNPNKIYMKMDKKKITFKKFYDEVASLSYGLKELGVKKGDKIAILLNNSIEFVVSYFAILCLGAIVVPINTFLRQDEIIYILNDCSAKILITSTDFNNTLKDFNFNKVQSLENIISLGNLVNIKNIDYETVKNKGKLNIPFVDVDEEEVAVLIYTSGTTGFPKGAMLTHKNLISNVKSSIKAIHINDNDKFIIFLPMFHAFSFTVCVLIPLYCQCNLTVIKSIQPFSKILKAILFDRITLFVAIPQVYNVLSNKKIPKWLLWLNPVRVCISGAAPLAGEVLRRFEEKFKIPLCEGYGLSEASPVVSVNPLDGVRKPGSVGPPIPGVEVKIVDEEGNFLKPGEIGEIVVKGPNVMKGYYNREVETSMTIRNGWLYTGDLGKIDEDGYIYIVDRKKDLIIVNGMNLYPREVEEVLYRHPAVQGAVVVGKKDEAHGEIPIGVILLKEGMSVTDQELKKFCKEHLANYKIPHRFEFWKELPLTGTGKILKREVKRIINER